MRTIYQIRAGIFIILALLLVVLMGNSVPSHAHESTPAATDAVAADQTFKFQLISMTSKTNGWAVVTISDPNGGPDTTPRSLYSGRVAYVLHTQDGGLTWDNVTPQPLGYPRPVSDYGCDCSSNGLADFFFLDDSHAWAATTDGLLENQVFNDINVWRTSYSGHSWQRSADGLYAPNVIITSFSDPIHGWMLVGNPQNNSEPDQPALLYRTIDGGLSWQFIADDGIYQHKGQPPISKTAGLSPNRHTGMVFESAASGWMSIQKFQDSPDDGAQILHTTDGGKSWYPVKVGSKSGSDTRLSGCAVSGLQLFTPGTLAFLADCTDQNNNSLPYFYLTTDNGNNWQHNSIPANFINARGPIVLYMLNSSTGWAIGCENLAAGSLCGETLDANPYALYETTDSAKNWVKITALPDVMASIYGDNPLAGDTQFDFIDAHHGWAVVPTGHLMETNDGGKSWVTLTPAIGVATSDATCPNTMPLRLAVGQKARITPGASNNLREAANRTAPLISAIPGSAEIKVVAGPVCDGQLIWWQVNYQGHTGWTVESDGQAYFIAPE